MLPPYMMQGRFRRSRAPKPHRYGTCPDCGHAVKLHIMPYFRETKFPIGTCIRCHNVCPSVVEMFKDAKDLRDVKKIGKTHKKQQSEEK